MDNLAQLVFTGQSGVLQVIMVSFEGWSKAAVLLGTVDNDCIKITQIGFPFLRSFMIAF